MSDYAPKPIFEPQTRPIYCPLCSSADAEIIILANSIGQNKARISASLICHDCDIEIGSQALAPLTRNIGLQSKAKGG